MPRLEGGFGQTPGPRLPPQAALPGPAGGSEQAVATSTPVSRPDSRRAATGRGSSKSARSRLPSTKRRLVRHTVEALTATWRAMIASFSPASAASRIWARLSVRAACRPPRNRAVSSLLLSLSKGGLTQFDPIAYIHGGPPGFEAAMNGIGSLCHPSAGGNFTEKQGPSFAFIYAYTPVQCLPPAQADR